MWNSTSNIDFSRFCFDQSIRLEVVHIWSMRALCLYTHTHFFFSVSLDISILLYCKQTPQRPLKWLNVLKTIFNTFRIEINIWKLSDTDGRWNIISNCDTRKTDEQKKNHDFRETNGMNAKHERPVQRDSKWISLYFRRCPYKLIHTTLILIFPSLSNHTK